MTRVADLTGAELALWVARALGMTINPDVCQPDDGVFVGEGCGDLEFFAPHEDWAQGGQLIERERIAIDPITRARDHAGNWQAQVWAPYACCTGPTPLIAAMRAFVASKFGETVTDQEAPCAQ